MAFPPLTDEESLAQNYGPSGFAPTEDPGYIDFTPEQAAATPSAPDDFDFTPEEAALMEAVGEVDDDGVHTPPEMVTSPGQTTAPAMGGPTTSTQQVGQAGPGNDLPPGIKSMSTGSSVTFKGSTPRGRAASKGVFGEEQAAADVKSDAYAAQVTAYRAEMDKRTQEQKAILDEQAGIESTYMNEVADIHKQQLEFQETQHKLEAMAMDNAKAESAGYIAAYKQDMVGVRQLMAQSGDPTKSIGLLGQSALSLGLFAQGFLGARYGIQVNVSGQIDKWVDRELQQHQQKISNATNAANSQLTLYDIARKGAQDDWEARTRLRGFVIDGIKSKLLVAADAFGAESAVTAAKAKGAELDREQTMNDMTLQDKVTQQSYQFSQQGIAKATERMRSSIEWGKIAADNKRTASQERIANLNKPKTEKPPARVMFLSDPFDVKRNKEGKVISGGKRKWAIDPNEQDSGVTTQATKKAGEVTAFYAQMGTNLDTLKELFPRASPNMKGPKWWRNKSSPEYRQYSQVKNYALEYLQQDVTGAAAPDAQAGRIQDWLREDNFAELGSNAGLIDGLKDLMRNKHEATMRYTPGIIAVPEGALEGDDQYDMLTESDPAGKALSAARRSNEALVKPGLAADAYNKVTNVDGSSPAGKKASALLREFADATSDEIKDTVAIAGGKSTPNVRVKAEKLSGRGGAATVAEAELENMARAIINLEKFGTEGGPNEYGVTPDKDYAAELLQDYHKVLETIAAGNDGVSTYAQYIQSYLKTDPDKLWTLLGEPKE